MARSTLAANYLPILAFGNEPQFPLLRTAEAAKVIGISPNTLRAWDRRYNLGIPRQKVGIYAKRGGPSHRRFRLDIALGLRDALDSGLAGQAAVERGLMLVRSGRYRDLPLAERVEELIEIINKISDRMWLLEHAMGDMGEMLTEILAPYRQEEGLEPLKKIQRGNGSRGR